MQNNLPRDSMTSTYISGCDTLPTLTRWYTPADDTTKIKLADLGIRPWDEAELAVFHGEGAELGPDHFPALNRIARRAHTAGRRFGLTAVLVAGADGDLRLLIQAYEPNHLHIKPDPVTKSIMYYDVRYTYRDEGMWTAERGDETAPMTTSQVASIVGRAATNDALLGHIRQLT